MTDFKSKTYTNEQIEAILAEYKQSGDPITVFCKNRGHKPAYQTLKGWLDAAGEGVEAKATTKAPAAKAAPASLADVEAAYKSGIYSLIATLEKREQELNEELDSVVKDLVKAREKLTKFD